MRTKKNYDQEFKRQAIELAKNSEKPISQIAIDLGLAPSTLFTWISRSKVDSKGKTITDNEITLLRKELVETKIERDILKKAMAIFSKQQK